MASNDPSDTGGLFVGRRPGTRPVRFRDVPADAVVHRRRDKLLAGFLLFVEMLLCITIWGPQPALALWFGSQVQYWAGGSVTLGIVAAFALMLITLFVTLAIARRVDHAWKLVRRAAGYHQERGALERIFVIALIVVGGAFLFWFLLINGPGSSTFSPQAPK
ncbi:MAG: hypothetical protein QOF37_2199 [Thermoleophilaceae bacterium]|jgi:hypothetical protein|nr:hypothetical protein [Thermoleophilaceae bacterium]